MYCTCGQCLIDSESRGKFNKLRLDALSIPQVFTIELSEIKFIVNHNSQSDGQNKSAKSGMNLRQKIIHINLLQRKDEDTKDNGI